MCISGIPQANYFIRDIAKLKVIILQLKKRLDEWTPKNSISKNNLVTSNELVNMSTTLNSIDERLMRIGSSPL